MPKPRKQLQFVLVLPLKEYRHFWAIFISGETTLFFISWFSRRGKDLYKNFFKPGSSSTFSVKFQKRKFKIGMGTKFKFVHLCIRQKTLFFSDFMKNCHRGGKIKMAKNVNLIFFSPNFVKNLSRCTSKPFIKKCGLTALGQAQVRIHGQDTLVYRVPLGFLLFKF